MKNLIDIAHRLFSALQKGERAPLTEDEARVVGPLEDQFHDKDWVSKELHHLERFDSDVAYQKVTHRQDGDERPRATRILMWAVAAIGLVLFGFTWWRGSYSPVPPALDQQTAQAIHRMEQSGGQEAQLTANGQAQNISRLDDIHSYEGRQQLRTPATKEFWVTLDDGTRVHLNNNSTLSYPSSFGSGERRVSLDGEAYFMVATDARRRFVVETPEGEVRDYGTQFNVNTQEGHVTTVALVEGSASVSPAGGTEHMMKPNQLATISNGHVDIRNADVAPYIAWNTGTFLFRDYRVDDLLKIISDWHNVTITCASEDVSAIRLTGALDRYSNFDDLCRSLEAITGHQVVKKGAGRYVLR